LLLVQDKAESVQTGVLLRFVPITLAGLSQCHHGSTKAVSTGSAASRIAHLVAFSMVTAWYSGFTCAAPVHFMLYASKLASNSASSAYMLKWHSVFELKFRGEANLSVVTLKPCLNACMYLFGVVHWFASLLLLLPSVDLPVYLFKRCAIAVGSPACVFQVGATASV